MVGKYAIRIYDSKVSYYLEIQRKITILRGDSATGKTTLINMLLDYSRLGSGSGVTVECDVKCTTFSFTDEMQLQILQNMHGYILFFDENNPFIRTQVFAENVIKSDNYFVIICRDDLPQLPYSIEEIYGLRESRDTQKHRKASRTYNELYKLYNLRYDHVIKPEIVITEDSNAGNECFSNIFDVECYSAKGKSNITKELAKYKSQKKDVLVIVDGAAFGSEMQQFIRKAENYGSKCVLYAPESFEYLILVSGIVRADNDIIENTYNYSDAKDYSSWEQYYTAYLTDITKETVLRYSKSKLNEVYLANGNIEKIKSQMPEQIEV